MTANDCTGPGGVKSPSVEKVNACGATIGVPPAFCAEAATVTVYEFAGSATEGVNIRTLPVHEKDPATDGEMENAASAEA